MRCARSLLVFMLAAALAGCAGEENPSTAGEPTSQSTLPADPGSTPEPSPEISIEGSITTVDGSFVEYPDGVVVRFKSIERLANDLAGFTDKTGRVVPLPDDQALLKVTVTVKNSGTEEIPLMEFGRIVTLYYGENRFEAQQDGGFSGAEDSTAQLSSDLPLRVVPGSSLDIFRSFDVPVAELSSLAVLAELRPDFYTPYTFTDVEAAL